MNLVELEQRLVAGSNETLDELRERCGLLNVDDRHWKRLSVR